MKKFIKVLPLLLVVLTTACASLSPKEQKLSANCEPLHHYLQLRHTLFLLDLPNPVKWLEMSLSPCDTFKYLMCVHEHPHDAAACDPDATLPVTLPQLAPRQTLNPPTVPKSGTPMSYSTPSLAPS